MSHNIVTVIDKPVNVTVSKAGIQGVPGTNGISSISGYATSGDLYNTGHILIGLITASSAGVSAINSSSGILNFTGAGNVSLIINGQNFIFSGISGNPTNVINLVYTTGNQIVSGFKDFNSGIGVSYISGDSNYNKGLIDNNALSSVDWMSRGLNDAGGIRSVSYDDRILKDGIQNYSIQWNDRFLRDATQNYVLDWNNHILSGNWFQNNNPILDASSSRVTGISILGSTQILTGAVTFSAGNNDVQVAQSPSTNSIVILAPGIQQTGSNLYSLIAGISGAGTVLSNSGISTNSFILGNQSFYIYKNSLTGTWTLPLINQSTGRTYFIKNQGNTLILTGQNFDLFFIDQLKTNFIINSGNAYIVANDGSYWSIM